MASVVGMNAAITCGAETLGICEVMHNMSARNVLKVSVIIVIVFNS